MEPLKTSGSQNELEKKQSWRYHTFCFPNILQTTVFKKVWQGGGREGQDGEHMYTHG